MSIEITFVFIDTPKKICFTIFSTPSRLPKPTLEWVEITEETYELIPNELLQSSLLALEISEGIKKEGFFIVDFSDNSTLSKYKKY
ncbi:MAG: hypothetical protein WAQ28_09980 [Bacteroidia bacterium]|jgi:hypothetical protein